MAADSQIVRSVNREVAALLVDSCIQRGIDHFFLAPGARCTPLTLAIADRRDARVVQHFDERGCAFACLGYARASHRPGVFVCTSGTAAANAFPAVVEASQDHVPMLLLTSDRPPELRETGANQTIDQLKMYSSYASWFFDLPCPDRSLGDNFWRGTINYAIARSVDGPVHVNCMFREPFGSQDSARPLLSPDAGDASVALTAEYHWHVPEGRTLVIAGNCRREEALAARELASRLKCPFLADISTGVRGLNYDLQLLRHDNPPADVVLHIGERVVSKRWPAFIDHHPPKHYLQLTRYATRVDPVHRGTQTLRGSLVELCAGAVVTRPSPQGFLEDWQRRSDECRSMAQQILASQTRVTEPGIAQVVADNLPVDSGLMLGNSMPVRDMDMFGRWEHERGVVVATNRGASGIDGLISTATGFAIGLQQPTTAVIGDLAALHDLNSLSLLAKGTLPVVLIVINNDGGGIFHFLPVASESSAFEQYFGTPHGYQFANAAKMFGLDYHQPTSLSEFTRVYQDAVRRPAATLIEVATDRRQNQDLHQQIAAAVREMQG